MENISIGEQIAKLRKAAGLTQEELGKAAGVSTQAVSRWECGGAPDVSLLPAIADKLGVTVDALFGRGGGVPDDMQDLLGRWFRARPEATRLADLAHLLWRVSLSALPVGLQDKRASPLPLPPSCEITDTAFGSEPVLIRTVYETEYGFMLQVGAEDMSFAAVFPEPEAGYARYLLPDEQYERLFSVLGLPGAVKLLRYLYSEKVGYSKTGYYTAALVARELGIPKTEAEALMERLAGADLLGRVEVAVEDGIVPAYVGKPDCGIVAFLYLARWTAQNKNRISYSCWDPRDTPYFRAPKAQKEGPADETH